MFKGFLVSIPCIFRNLFTVNIIRRHKWHIVMIALIAFLTSSAIVIYPCFVKLFFNPTGQISSKFFNDGLNFGKLGTKERLYFDTLGPIYGNGIKPFKFGYKFGSESGSGNIKSIVPLSVDCKAITDQSHKEKTASTEQPNIRSRETKPEDYHIVLLSLMPMFLMTLYWVIYMLLSCGT